MAKAVKRILCMILLSSLLIGIIPCTHVEATYASNQIKTGMGYTFLKNDTQRRVYMQLAQDAADLRPIIRFHSEELATWEETEFVLEMFYADFPEFYWVGNEYGESDMSGRYSNAMAFLSPHIHKNF